MARKAQQTHARKPQPSKRQSEQPGDVRSPKIRQLIAWKAGRIVAQTGLARSEQPDIEQDLLVALLRALPAFDPQRGDWLPFAERTLQHASKVWLRARFAGKRAHGQTLSLNVTVQVDPQEGSAELAQLISGAEGDARIGVTRRDDLELLELCEDVNTLIAMLPFQLREFARALKHESIHEIARRTGVPPTSLYRWLTQLRKAAENTSLAEYL